MKRDTYIAFSSVLAVTLGIFTNTIASTAFTWSIGSVFLTVFGVILIIGLTVLVLRGSASRNNRSDSASLEKAATKRVISTLVDIKRWDTWSSDMGIDVPMTLRSIAGRDVDMRASSSAFIASLTENPQCTIITGQPGSGKTWLARQLVLKIALAHDSGESRWIPLLLQGKDWTGNLSFQMWTIFHAQSIYGLSPNLTSSWMSEGKAIVVVDALDEISPELWPSFRDQMNGWLSSAVGGRAIATCRHQEYVQYVHTLKHEQVATLQPLSRMAVADYFSRLIDRIDSPTKRDEVAAVIRDLTVLDLENNHPWSTPLLLHMLTTVVIQGGDDSDIEKSSDPAAVAVKIGDNLTERGDEEGALESYLAAIRSRSSHWSSLAGLRACSLLARSGDVSQNAFSLLVTVELEESLRDDELKPIRDQLSDDERQVMAVLSPGVSLDAYQVSSMASVPPSRCNNALRRLRDRGLVEVIEFDDRDPRFRRSEVELVQK